MDLTGIFVSSFIVGFSGAMMPGPLLTVTISEAARRGFLAGPLIVLGHALLEIGLVLALAAGLSAYMTNTSVSQAIALLGGGFLIYLGYTITRDAATGRVSLFLPNNEPPPPDNPSIGIDNQEIGQPIGVGKTDPANHKNGTVSNTIGIYLGPVLSGLFISLANPFVILWWATVGLGYINLSLRFGNSGLGAFYSGHILADLVWYCLVAAVVAGSRRFLNDRVYRGILILCGLFLIGLGGYFFYTGVV